MVESGREYVLQWTGHAAHVTERFSGLLARQALVDVTLICQGQKLRVHKLVLASSSLYFEEMLEQDLGAEPVILLRDLDFEVLKAMVEFMYCGETTISQCHLQTLLDAAQVFKVKELKCIVESMLKSKITSEKVSPDNDESSSTTDNSDVKKNIYKLRPNGERCDEKTLSSDFEQSELSEIACDRTFDNNSRMNYIDEGNSLYETAENVEERTNNKESLDDASVDTSDSETSKMSMTSDEDDESSSENHKIVSSTDEKVSKSLYNESYCTFIGETKLHEGVFNESFPHNSTNCQDLPRSVGECSRVYTHKKRKFTDNKEFIEEINELSEENSMVADNLSNDSLERQDDKKIDKRLKVYTHKRLKSFDEKKAQRTENISDDTEEPTSTSGIDLGNDQSHVDPPINLSTGLDMETSEYIWSLSTESIQYVVGCTVNAFNSSLINNETKNTCESVSRDEKDDEITTNNDETGRQIKELYPLDNGNQEIPETPVLRRSVRINQLESDDSLNNNSATLSVPKVRDKTAEIDSDDCTNDVTMNLTKSKRRVTKDGDFRITDENIVTTSNSVRKNGNSRSLRSQSKLSSRKSNTSRCATTRDERTKNPRQNRERMEKIDSHDILVNTRLNTIASVDRALWGDMSDVLEDRENSTKELLNYTTSREIPFAVGLLPLRAALERMQATLDHQPRKTRSSVAPFRHEINGYKRKCSSNDAENVGTTTRKQCNMEDETVETAVCHIEIRTSSRCNETQNRRVSTDKQIITVGSTSESNEQ